MIRTLIFVFVSAFIILSTVWLADHPGNLSVVWGGGRLDVELPVVLGGLLLFTICVGLLYRLWWSIRRAPKVFWNARQIRKRERGYKALTQGMVAVAAGDANEAKSQAQKADKFLGEPPLTMLLSAQAAQLNGDEAAAKRYFNSMLKQSETAFLGLRGLLMQAERAGDTAAALAYAGRAKTLQPKTPWVLTKMFELQIQQGQWQSALLTLNQVIKANEAKDPYSSKLKPIVLLGCSIEVEKSGDGAAALSFAEKAHKEQPKNLPAIVCLAQLMNEEGKTRGLQKLIKGAWSHSPHPALAKLYAGSEFSSDALMRVKRFEELREINPDHPESRIALVQALINANIWGAARKHLQALGLENPSARICRLMAELEEGENKDTEKIHYWLVRASSAEPDPSWVCSGCAAANVVWVPLCGRCGSLGSLEWRVSEHVVGAFINSEINALPFKSMADVEKESDKVFKTKQDLLIHNIKKYNDPG